jgi:lysophospholipase L1-like esterase
MTLSRRTRVLALCAMVIAAVSVPCLVAEAVLRFISPPPDTPGLFVPTASAMDYIGRPGAHGVVSGVSVSFNQLGLRDRDYALRKPPGATRIIALGDSMTFGVGVSEPDTFPRVTERLLNQRLNRPGSVEILNFGIPGYNTPQELAQFQELGLPLRPDIVVVGFLYNDLEISPEQRHRLEQRNVSGGGRPSGSDAHVVRAGFRDGSTSGSVTSELNAALSGVKRHSMFLAWLAPRLAVLLRPLGVHGVGLLGDVNAQFVESNPEWRRVQSELLQLKRLCDDRNIRLEIMIIPAMTNFQEGSYPVKPYHEAVSRFCGKWSIPCLDLLPAFWGKNGMRMWISATDGHPNAEGHRIMAEALAAFLEPAVAQVSRDHGGGRP